jgi:hypothetical protein
MKKKIRVFGDKACPGCVKLMEITKGADIIIDNGHELDQLYNDENSEEWEKIMKRTGVWFLPHVEITWYDTDLKKNVEVHLSSVRDFDEIEDCWEQVQKILNKDYHHRAITMDEVEMTERIKSLTIMQEMLYDNMKKNIKYFTNLRNFLNMSGSQLEAEPQDTNNYI